MNDATQADPADAGDKTRWIENRHTGFGQVRPEDDLLHLAENPPGAAATETYYFGFSVPEQAINGYIYIWFHPNLRVVSAGSLVYQGFRRTTLAADYADIRAYLAMDEHVDADSGRMAFPSGLTLEPLELMQRWKVRLEDKGSGNSFDLEFAAAQPAVVRADQKHFDQAMHVTGELTLRGRRHRVDCRQIRDRSWQNLRAEDPLPVPPYDWLTLTRGDAFAMNLSMFDDLAVLGNPDGRLQVPADPLQDGWVFVDGALRRIVAARKRTERDPATLAPTAHRIHATDETGAEYELHGQAVAGCNWSGWPNMLWHQALLRWTCNGEPAWGESQEVQWHELIHLLGHPQARP